jgi:hypothetical protein
MGFCSLSKRNQGAEMMEEHYRCEIKPMGVQIYSTKQLEEDEKPDFLLNLSFTEALEISRYLIAHESGIRSRQTELESQYEQLSKDLVVLFVTTESEARQREHVFMRGLPREFNQLLNVAYQRLKKQKATLIRHWYQEDEQAEVDFWIAFERFFEEHHWDDLIAEFSPEDAQND